MDVYEQLMQARKNHTLKGPSDECKEEYSLTGKLVYRIERSALSEPSFPKWYKPTGDEAELVFGAGPEDTSGFMLDCRSDMDPLTTTIFSDIPGIDNGSANSYCINGKKFTAQTDRKGV